MNNPIGPIIGLDLDNTLVSYDELLCELAVSEGYLSPPTSAQSLGMGKRALRDAIRARSDSGERDWRRLQSLVYGAKMHKARLMNGVEGFLDSCSRLRAEGVPFQLYIVSHKTQFANNYSDGTDFHQAAMRFLEEHGFFAPETGLTKSRVFFEPTREDKVARIVALGCTHFVDDLEETFAEPTFPEDVVKILIDPKGDASPPNGVTRIRHWDDIGAFLLSDLEAMVGFSQLAGEPVASYLRIYGGRNSRVFRIVGVSGKCFAGKHYHQHQDDPRDRLGNEWGALELLADAAVLADFVARPVAKDVAAGLALYSFLEGEQANQPPASSRDIKICLEFLVGLQKFGATLPDTQAAVIGNASEACFSLDALERNIRQRIKPLLATSKSDGLCDGMHQYLEQELFSFFEQSLVAAQKLLVKDLELSSECKTLSPSDFGLHNALRNASSISFVDFEYFGWDDPAKILCDFVLHPAMDLPESVRDEFVKGFLCHFSRVDESLYTRVCGVFPLYGVKWCLILLNEFLRASDDRRQFAAQGNCVGDRERRGVQLEKARNMLNKTREIHAIGLC